MKKWFYGLGAVVAVATPIIAVVSCSNDEVHTGPRGGTYTISSGGHREYFGHHSNYR